MLKQNTSQAPLNKKANQTFHMVSPYPNSNSLGPFKAQSSQASGMNRWLLPYADLVTLLLVLFVAMALMGLKPSVATAKQEKNDSTKATAVASKQTAHSSKVEHLKQQLAKSKTPVEVYEDDRGIVLSFQEKIFFAPGSAQIQPQAFSTLNRLADVLKNTPGNIRVEGHTDNVPIKTSQYPSNWELSTDRATAILRHFVQSQNLSPQRLSAAGYGEYKPRIGNDTEGHRQQNRRVDIVLLPDTAPTAVAEKVVKKIETPQKLTSRKTPTSPETNDFQKETEEIFSIDKTASEANEI